MAARGLNFNDTEIAFKARSTLSLRKAQLLFKSFDFKALVAAGPRLLNFALGLRLPVKPLIRATIFEQFCGGETIEDCRETIAQLARFGIGSILDYSVEGRERESDFDAVCAEITRVVLVAHDNRNIRFAVFKMTGIGRVGLLSRLSDVGNDWQLLTKDERAEFARMQARLVQLCRTAHDKGVRILIDAEESWIQDAVDHLALMMMREFNRQGAVVYNTVQLYRHDRLSYLKALHQCGVTEGFVVGVKLVRGAYMEKERARAAKLGLPSPIHKQKSHTDRDYDEALGYCINHIEQIHLCSGTHNERSNLLLTQLMQERGVRREDPRVEFAQLLGMSDNQSYNLVHHGYNVSKYVPYGPVHAVLPYLFRRAEENTSIQGQAGRELQLIEKELKRRAKN